jgi:hypothetical protein
VKSLGICWIMGLMWLVDLNCCFCRDWVWEPLSDGEAEGCPQRAGRACSLLLVKFNFIEMCHLLQVAAFEAHKQRRRMSVKDNVHVRLNVHGSAFECPSKHPIKHCE